MEVVVGFAAAIADEQVPRRDRDGGRHASQIGERELVVLAASLEDRRGRVDRAMKLSREIRRKKRGVVACAFKRRVVEQRHTEMAARP